MKEHPILFSTPMIQAILAGRKTMTRRILKNTLEWDHNWKPNMINGTGINGVQALFEMRGTTNPNQYSTRVFKCPYGQPGDRLWVRETWRPLVSGGPTNFNLYDYKADWDGKLEGITSGWKLSIHMPKAACRIWLEITGVSVERLRQISEADAQAEGVETLGLYPGYDVSSRGKFEGLWNSINGNEANISKNILIVNLILKFLRLVLIPPEYHPGTRILSGL